MSQLEEFKKFVTTIPSVRDDGLSGRYTWQQLYEIYTMYGEDDKFWNAYKQSTGMDFSGIMDVVKNVDLDSVSSGLHSLEKMLGMASSFLVKDEPEKPQKQKYKWYDE
ncbi:MAG: spore coat protein YlbD [Coprobacillaceae bacterium]